MKALLIRSGFGIHTEIWSDQPGFFPLLLTCWFKFAGQSVVNSRLLVALLSATLLWSLMHIVRREANATAAIIAGLLLILSPAYLRLSVSVMVGLPAFSFAMWAIACLFEYRTKHAPRWLIASGSLMALALQTKLSTILLVPACASFLLSEAIYRKEGSLARRCMELLGRWGGSFILVFIAFALLTSADFDQLVSTHVGQAARQAFSDGGDSRSALFKVMRSDLVTVGLVVLGVPMLVWKRSTAVVFPLVWFITALVAHLWHRPFWYYHYLHMAIPMAWLAGLGVSAIIDEAKQHLWRESNLISQPGLISAMTLVLCVALTASELLPTFQRVSATLGYEDDPSHQEAIKRLKANANRGKWVLTDNPILAYHAGLLVPPEAAVLSPKRARQDAELHTKLIAVCQRYRPEQVIWTDPQFLNGDLGKHVLAEYVEIARGYSLRHYIRRDLMHAFQKPD